MKGEAVQTALLVAHDYPPFTGGEGSRAARWVQMLSSSGHGVEIIAASDGQDEFIHLDAFGNLVHRVVPERSYAAGALARLGLVAGPAQLGFALRAAEKAFELRRLWNRAIPPTELLLSQLALVAPAVAGSLWPLLASEATERRRVPAPARVRSIDLVICTYDRFDELLVSIDSALIELGPARQAGIGARLRVLYQNADLLDRIRSGRPELLERGDLAFELSAPPSLTGARNRAVATSSADLMVFIDDDVALRPGFLAAYLEAAERHPDAIGFAGRIESPSEWEAGRARAIGQIRPTGYIDVNYNSVNRDGTFVPLTPMGANMAFRRERMKQLFGKSWFDSSLTGSAIREETTLALEINRRGEHFVFVPDAALDHFEARRGGCHNREERSPWERLQHRTLETLFLARLHQGTGPLHAASALLAARREARSQTTAVRKLGVAAVHLAGYVAALRRYRTSQMNARLSLVPRAEDSKDGLPVRAVSA